ncbi:MAG: hypothetical protein ACRC5C_05955 [Bacilli bacterium]
MDPKEILLQYVYRDVIVAYATLSEKPMEEALTLFYRSSTYDLIREGIADMHCRSPYYLAEELMLELGEMKRG